MSFVNCEDCGNEIKKISYMIGWGLGSNSSRCRDCISKSDDGEFDSDDSFRCPKCRTIHNVSGTENYQLYEEPGGDVYCDECEHEFHVDTHISYRFTSPEMNTAKNEK